MKSNSVDFQPTPNPALAGVLDITVDSVFAHRDQIVIIDVRRPDEWSGEYGHIAEAKLISLHTLPAHVEELRAMQLPKVFVCLSGGRSAQAAAFATQQGISNVFNMQGGMVEWTHQELPAVNRSEAGI